MEFILKQSNTESMPEIQGGDLIGVSESANESRSTPQMWPEQIISMARRK